MKRDIIGGIYKITSPSGKIYIGQSVDIIKRWRHHKINSNLIKNKKSKLVNSFIKYGSCNHKFEIIEECSSTLLNEREIYWITFYNTFLTLHGLNLSYGGDSGMRGRKHSDETKRKMSDTGKIKIFTEDHRKNLSLSLKGKKFSEERRLQISLYSKGRVISKNARLKISLANKGKPKSKEHIDNMKKNHVGATGKKWTEAHVQKIREANSKIVLNEHTGIFYDSAEEAAKVIPVPPSTLRRKLCGITPNNTPFTYV